MLNKFVVQVLLGACVIFFAAVPLTRESFEASESADERRQYPRIWHSGSIESISIGMIEHRFNRVDSNSHPNKITAAKKITITIIMIESRCDKRLHVVLDHVAAILPAHAILLVHSKANTAFVNKNFLVRAYLC